MRGGKVTGEGGRRGRRDGQEEAGGPMAQLYGSNRQFFFGGDPNVEIYVQVQFCDDGITGYYVINKTN